MRSGHRRIRRQPMIAFLKAAYFGFQLGKEPFMLWRIIQADCHTRGDALLAHNCSNPLQALEGSLFSINVSGSCWRVPA